MDVQSQPKVPTIVSQSRPMVFQMGESSFSLQAIEIDGAEHTQLKLYQQRTPHDLIQAEGRVVSVSVEPLDQHDGVYMGLLTQCQDDAFLATLIIETAEGIVHEQRSLSVDSDNADDLALRFSYRGNCLFVTSHRKDGTLTRVDNIIKERAA